MAVLKKETGSNQDKVEEELATVLRKLMNEEAGLMEEKKNLVSLRKKLQLKVQKEVEIKKESVQKLRAEIAELKFSCEELSRSIKVGATSK